MGVFRKLDVSISGFFDKMAEPTIAFSDEEIIFKNKAFEAFFKEDFVSWHQIFDDPVIQQHLKLFFLEGDLPLDEHVTYSEGESGEIRRITWTFENLPVNYLKRICLAKVKLNNSLQDIKLISANDETVGYNFLENLDFIQSILHNSHDMLALLDENGIYKFISTSIIDKLGFLPEQIIGKSFREFQADGILAFDEENIEELFTSNEEVKINFWINRLDGTKIYIESYGRNLLHDPNVRGILFSARDITDYFDAKTSLQKRYELENLINRISAKFVNAGYDGVNDVFNDSLSMLGKFEKADRAYIFLVHEEIQVIENVYEWTAEDIAPQIDQLKNLSIADSISITIDSLRDGQILIIPDVEALPDEFASEREIYLSQGILSVILIPIFSENRLIGFFGLDAVRQKRNWNEKDEYVLRQLGDIYAGSFINQSIKKRLDRNEKLLAETEILAKSGSWRFSNSKNRVFFSKGLNQIFELDDQLYSEKPKDFIKKIAKSDRAQLLSNIREAIHTISSVSGEFTLNLKENKHKHISYRIQVRPLDDVGKLEVFGYCSDITAKKDAENYLRLQSQVLAQVFDPILVVNIDFKIIYMNKAALKECGLESEGGLKGKIFDYFEFLTPEGEDFIKIISSLQEGEAYRKELDIKLNSGYIEPYDVSIQPFLNDQYEKLGYSFLLRNRSLIIKQEALAKKAKLIVENSPAVLFTVDPNDHFRILYISENIRQFGYEAENLIHNQVSILDLIHQDDLEHILQYHKKRASDKGIPAYSGEYRIKKSDGTYRWVEDKSKEIQGQNKQIQFHEGLIQDITDQKRDREEIIRSQERYRVLASNIPNTSIFLIDRDLRYIVAQGTTFETWGMTSADFEGKTMEEVHKFNLSEIQPSVIRALIKKEIVQKHLFYRKRIYEIIIRPIIYQGEVEYALGILRDVNEEFQAKEDLKKNEEKYRKLVEESTEVIYSLSSKMTLTYVSPNIQQFLGYDFKNVIGSSITEFLHPDDKYILNFSLDEANSNQNQYWEFRLRHQNGEYRIFSSNGKVVHNEEDKEMYYTGIARDITKLKEAQRELFYAKEKAEQASIIKSQFLSIMSHEIRTPMNAVIGMAHLLIEDNPRPDQLENLKTLQFSAENLLGLINDILDYSKIDSGKVELEQVNFELNTAFNRILHSYTYQAREKSLDIVFDSDPTLPKSIVGDPVRLGQVINNLVSNAIKFTEKGFVKITLKKVSENEHSVTVKFDFEDTGIGIPEEKLQSVFEAFTQASAETTRKYGGTGLGLAIVKRLVELFGSEIKIFRKESGGTLFSFEIAFDKYNFKTISPLKNVGGGIKSLSSAVILVAEDNLVNQVMIRKFLDKWGVKQVVIASDGIEALSALETQYFNLVLLDLQMPAMDGFEVARNIRNMKSTAHRSVPIIALTASSLLDVKEQLDDVGIDDYISKPFNPDDLYAKMIKYLKV
jgi:PAS domain S-box-containing protein